MIYFIFGVPFITVLILLLFFKSNVVWWEIIIPLVISTILIFSAKAICIHSLTSDIQYLGGYVEEVRYYEDWNEYIHRICTRSCGKGCTTTYNCSYVQYHPEYWTVLTTLGEFKISENKYLSLLQQFNSSPIFKELYRHYHTNDGDMYYGTWKGEDSTLEPIVLEDSYENRPKAAVNVYHFNKPDSSDVKQYKLFDYPLVQSLFKQDLILGYEDKIAERKLQILNARLGNPKQVRTFILIFKNQPIQAGIMQENYWEGSNKNEFIVCIGIDNDKNIQWVHDFSWTEKEECKVETRHFIESQKKLNLSKTVDYLYEEIQTKFLRKNFEDFDYLNIEPTRKQIVWILIITVLINISIAIWVVKNDINEETYETG